MKKGLLIYYPFDAAWRVWIGQKAYRIEQGEILYLRIHQTYFPALLEKDEEWMITIQEEVTFTLHPYEVYKIRINPNNLSPVNAPF